jgi:ketosteroid isomerase-like protein
MKNIWLLAAILLCAVSTLAQTGASADEKAIRDLDKAWIKAAQDKNIDKAVSYYADDASVMPPGAPIATTPQQRRAVWQSLLSDPKTTLNFGRIKLEIAKSGDLAYDLGWTEWKTTDAQGKTTTERGKYVVVWKKINGQWKVVADIVNQDK